MAYSGSTAASSVANPPILLVRGVGNLMNASGAVVFSTALPQVGGCGLWYYCSSDPSTFCQGTAYFTDGKQLGMRLGDVMIGVAATSIASTVITSWVGVLVTTNSTAGWNICQGGNIMSS